MEQVPYRALDALAVHQMRNSHLPCPACTMQPIDPTLWETSTTSDKDVAAAKGARGAQLLESVSEVRGRPMRLAPCRWGEGFYTLSCPRSGCYLPLKMALP